MQALDSLLTLSSLSRFSPIDTSRILTLPIPPTPTTSNPKPLLPLLLDLSSHSLSPVIRVKSLSLIHEITEPSLHATVELSKDKGGEDVARRIVERMETTRVGIEKVMERVVPEMPKLLEEGSPPPPPPTSPNLPTPPSHYDFLPPSKRLSSGYNVPAELHLLLRILYTLSLNPRTFLTQEPELLEDVVRNIKRFISTCYPELCVYLQERESIWAGTGLTLDDADEIKLDFVDLSTRHEDIYLPLLEDFFTHIYPLYSPYSSSSYPPSRRYPSTQSSPPHLGLPVIMLEAVSSISSFRPDICRQLLPLMVGLSWSEDVRVAQAAAITVRNITDAERMEFNTLLEEKNKGNNAVKEEANVARMLVCDEGNSVPDFIKKLQVPTPYYPSSLATSTPLTWSPDLLTSLNNYATFLTTTTLGFFYGALKMRSQLFSKGEQFTNGKLTRPLAVRLATYAGGGFVCGLGTVIWCLLSREFSLSPNSKHGFKFGAKSSSLVGDPPIWSIRDVISNPDSAAEVKSILRVHQEPNRGGTGNATNAKNQDPEDIERDIKAAKSYMLRTALMSALSTGACAYISLSVAPTAIVPIGIAMFGPSIYAEIEQRLLS